MSPRPQTHPRLRHASPSSRANPHALPRKRARSGLAPPALLCVTGLVAGLAAGLVAGCDGARGGAPAASPDSLTLSARSVELPPPTPQGVETVDRLVEALTPLDPNLTSDHHDRHLERGRALLAELREAESDVGVAALRRLREAEIADPLVRRGLLEVGSHAAPELAQPLLVKLIEEYGHDYAVRTFAVEFLSETSPETALAVLEPHLKKRGKPNKTMPPDEFLIRGYATAARSQGVDPTMMLADVATNLWMEDAARHFAVEELGRYPGDYARTVLEALLVESTGNSYIRRKAAQSLRDSLPAETACALFRRVADHEVEHNMLLFLLDMLRENCE